MSKNSPPPANMSEDSKSRNEEHAGRIPEIYIEAGCSVAMVGIVTGGPQQHTLRHRDFPGRSTAPCERNPSLVQASVSRQTMKSSTDAIGEQGSLFQGKNLPLLPYTSKLTIIYKEACFAFYTEANRESPIWLG